MSILIIQNSRAEVAPLESVRAALPEAAVASYDAAGLSPAIAMAQALPYFAAVYQNAKPKLVIVLGDRYETLAAALAAFFLRIPIAHLHGGETTTGAFDDAFRHSITHMAALHFAPTTLAGQRIAQLINSEDGGLLKDAGIYIVGAPGLDGIEQSSAKMDHKTFLVTYHPETMLPDNGLEQCEAMLAALKKFLGYEMIFCGVNSDPGGDAISRAIQNKCNTSGGMIAGNLSHHEYVEKMHRAACVIGNSSAGIIEAPWVGCASVNIGNRQNGRPMADSVVSVCGDSADIAGAISKALAFRGFSNPYYLGGAAPKIANICRQFLCAQG